MPRILPLLLVLLWSAPAFAQGKAAAAPPSEVKVVYPAFKDAEIRLILDYYRPGSRNLPPGLAKRGGDLPPGLAKQLRRGGTLPPGLEKKIEPFPNDLARRLPLAPEGYRRMVCGSSALLVQDAANLIVDIIELTKH